MCLRGSIISPLKRVHANRTVLNKTSTARLGQQLRAPFPRLTSWLWGRLLFLSTPSLPAPTSTWLIPDTGEGLAHRLFIPFRGRLCPALKHSAFGWHQRSDASLATRSGLQLLVPAGDASFCSRSGQFGSLLFQRIGFRSGRGLSDGYKGAFWSSSKLAAEVRTPPPLSPVSAVLRVKK